jgi:signal peptidase II
MNLRKVIITLVVLLFDQFIKYLAQTISMNIVLIDNILQFKYVQNDGAAFSILSGHPIFLIIITLAISLIIYKFMYSYKENISCDIAFGLIYGGIFGNLIDRVIFQYVRDFISIGSFPVFNIADSAIVIGVILLLIITIKGEIDGRKRNNDDNSSGGESRGKTRQVSNKRTRRIKNDNSKTN